MYYERFRVEGATGPFDRFDVYVLLRLPQAILDEEERRLELDRKRRLNLALVVDRSGSMSDGGKMAYVKEAVRLVARNLTPAGERELATLTVTYDRLAGSIDRDRATYPLRVEYTGDRRRVEAGRDPRVEHYLQVLATMDAMVLAMTSGSSKAMREVVDYLESDLDELRQWTRKVDDPEMTSVAQVFEECLTEFQRGGMRHGSRGGRDPDAAKAVRYKLYRFHRGQSR